MQMKRIYRSLVAVLIWGTLILKFWMNATSGKYPNVAITALEFVSFFTHLSTILVGLALAVPLISSGGRLRTFFEMPAVRAALALYILIVAVVYHVLIAPTDVNEDLFVFTNLLLHTIIPILYILDWLIFAPKRPVFYKGIPYWLIFPACYGIFTIIKGNITGAYPYSFLNMNELGISGVTVNMIGFLVLFSVGAVIFITVNKLFPSR